MLSSGVKELLMISACTVDDAGNISVNSPKQDFEVMLNPSSYKHDSSIDYNAPKTPGKGSKAPKYTETGPEKVSFDIVIDGTGVVDTGGSLVAVKTQVASLKDIVYTYVGKQHEPNPVRLLWGSLIFFGRLTSISVDYTLFKPSGEPLRAKVGLAFSGFISKEEEALRSNRSSPDLTHIVEVRAGDTLPLLCYQIYKNPSYYPDIARVNNLGSFRGLEPGTRLQFPPLR